MGKKKDKEKDKDKKKKDKKKKDKKDKKKKEKKKKDKKTKKKASSSSDSGSDDSSEGGSSSSSAPAAKKPKKEKVAKEKDEGAEAPIIPAEAPKVNLEALSPPEDGIKRFIFQADEVGPLGLRFSGGFPPMILAVLPDTFASKKKMLENWEVHAINGHAVVPQNNELVMLGLKSRPVALDVRPIGWKPPEKLKELERKREREEAERQVVMQKEELRRQQVAADKADLELRQAAEKSERDQQDAAERKVFEVRAREKVAKMRAVREEFERGILEDPEDFRKAAEELMQAEYGAHIKISDRRGVPLRLLSRRKDVAWIWYGEPQELIGGGVQGEPGDTWSE